MVSGGLAATAPFPPKVRAFTTLRHGAGVSAAPFDSFNLGNFRGADGDDPVAVARNRAELVARFGLPSAPHWLRQVHGTRVLRFDAPALRPPQPSPASGGGSLDAARWEGSLAAASGERSLAAAHRGGSLVVASGGGSLDAAPTGEGLDPAAAFPPPPLAGEDGGRIEAARITQPHHRQVAFGDDEPEADAAVTGVAGVVLAILTADCLPVVFAAKDGSEIAAAHAGWPGLSQGMLEATLAAMRTPPADVLTWIGPCAGPASYEVGRNVFDAFVSHDAAAVSAFVATREDHWLADLPALARRRLTTAGMSMADIHGGTWCTMSEPDRFFSHRRDGRSGRIATLAWIGLD